MDVSRAHAAAIAAMLNPLPYKVYVGEVTDSDADLTYPYLVLWPPPKTLGAENLTGNLLRATTRTQMSAVGQDPNETLEALGRADSLLVGKRPAIEGRSCGQLTHAATSGPPTPNPSVRTRPASQPTHLAWVIYSLTSIPAPA